MASRPRFVAIFSRPLSADTPILENHRKITGESQENHRKQVGKSMDVFFVILCSVHGKDMAKSSVELFCFVLDSELFDLVMGEPENLDVHDFWIFGTCRTPYLGI